jgi:LuxR family transcriptional regulator, maltose regulon positive regulatory protein
MSAAREPARPAPTRSAPSRPAPPARAAPRRPGPALQSTKLHAPPIRPGTVRRERLTSLLISSPAALTLIVAPAGFGKTSLLADWADVDPRPFAWVAIDVQDNDPTMLWSYIATALGRVVDGGRRASSFDGLAREPDPAAAVAAEIDADDTPVVLVLDDYHLVENDECHDSVMRFVELSPPNLHVAIASRSDPPFPVARLRAIGELLELRATDLQFAQGESEELLNDRLALHLDPEMVEILHDRTEGWPAGLYLAYLSMQASPNRRAFVETFGASNRHVIDYLTEQVLIALDPALLRFMLSTSIVDSVCGSLADAITTESGSAARLAELERANVFITPLDERREWYRYHHLLAELLTIELERRQPDGVPLLHQRAAQWYAEHALPDRAVRHAIAAGDIDLAARVISENYLRFLELGRTATLLGWLESMPAEVVESERRLGVVKAWTMHFLGRHGEGNAALADAIAAPAATGPLPDGAASIDATAALIGAAFPGDDVGRMLTSARRAFEFEAHRDSPWRTTVHVLKGFALVRSGAFEDAREPLRLGADLAMSLELWMDAVGAGTLLARVELECGDAVVAERLVREAIDLGDIHGLGGTPTFAYAQSILGMVLVRSGAPVEGGDHLTQSLPALRALGEPLSVAEALLMLAQARRAIGRRTEATSLSREAASIIDAMRDPGAALVALRRSTQAGRGRRPSDHVSPRELEVLVAMAGGASKRQAADQLYVSYNTVHSHVRSLYQKLDAHSLPEAVDRARQLGLMDNSTSEARKSPG